VKQFDAVILMGHGSRVPDAGKGMEMVAERLLGDGTFKIVETCYMERLGTRFADALGKCVEQGAKSVLLLPYFLHTGLHTRVDIPMMMRREAEKHDGIKVVFGNNLGFDELLVELVRKRINESAHLKDVREIDIKERDDFPLGRNEHVFVPMHQDEAEHFKDHKHEH